MRTFSIIWQFVYIYHLLLNSHPHNSRRYLQSKKGSFIWKQLSDYCDISPATKLHLSFYEVQYINSFFLLSHDFLEYQPSEEYILLKA